MNIPKQGALEERVGHSGNLCHEPWYYMSCKAGRRQFVIMSVRLVGKMLIHQSQGQLGPSRHYIHYIENYLLAA